MKDGTVIIKCQECVAKAMKNIEYGPLGTAAGPGQDLQRMWKELLFDELEVQSAMLENRTENSKRFAEVGDLVDEMEVRSAMLESRTKHSKRFAEDGDLNEMIRIIRVRHSGIWYTSSEKLHEYYF